MKISLKTLAEDNDFDLTPDCLSILEKLGIELVDLEKDSSSESTPKKRASFKPHPVKIIRVEYFCTTCLSTEKQFLLMTETQRNITTSTEILEYQINDYPDLPVETRIEQTNRCRSCRIKLEKLEKDQLIEMILKQRSFCV